ncbi:GNAT family N-acetyltransferase [Hominifimenecus sp. rT4P-3]|uniref:GNAT family N-acetyltransferase n=1 Tax=Hominifimenecus sp. rT4P-3 TaxID=3242979 RepID=UPI003DA2C40D
MIRIATEQDAEQLREIYAYYVKNTAITFEYEVPSVDEFRTRICKTLERYPYLVAERENIPVGYAYAGAFKERKAYDWSVETTIYVAKDVRKSGVGRELYAALENALAYQNIINLNACIASPIVEDEYLTANSIQYHEHFGYKVVGEFHKCGYKFGRWYNMVWMEKCIAEHPDHPLPMIPFARIRDKFAEQYKEMTK